MAAKVKGTRSAPLDVVIEALIGNRPLHADADPSTLDPLARGDRELSRGEYEKAIAAYGEASKPLSSQTKAKLGFTLVASGSEGSLKEAAELLSMKNVGKHPIARAAFVRVLARDRGFHRRQDDTALARTILAELLADERPHRYIFATAVDLGRQLMVRDDLIAIARRGLELHPEWDYGALRLVRLLRHSAEQDPQALERVLPLVPMVEDANELADMFAYAYDLRHVSGMDAVLARLVTFPRGEDAVADVMASQLEVLRGARDLVAGVAGGDSEAIEAALQRMPEVEHVSGPQAWELAKLRLRLALATDSDEAIRAAAARLLDVFATTRVRIWMSGLDEMTAEVDGLAWGYFRISVLEIEVHAHRERIIGLFRDFDAEALRALFDLDTAIHRGDAEEAVFEHLASNARHFLPRWTLATAAGVLTSSEAVDYEAIGAIAGELSSAYEHALASGDKARANDLFRDLEDELVPGLHVDELGTIVAGMHAQLVESAEGITGFPVLLTVGPKLVEHRQAAALEKLAQEVEQRTGSGDSMFYLAQAAELRGKVELAIERYERAIERDRDNAQAMWNLAQLYAARGNARGLAQLAKRLKTLASTSADEELRSRAAEVEQMRARADAGYVPPPVDPIDRELASFPAVGSPQWTPEDLSLTEAVVLIALLRSGEIDHIHWTLPPLRTSPRELESRKRLIGTLFQLARRGLIGFDPSTPRGAYSIVDGNLSVYLHQVVWKIAPATLQLEREIRHLRREDWPEEWTAAARRLAIDLGTDDVLAYFHHCMSELGLPTPDDQEVREIVGAQLERLSIANVYYLAHKTARSALEHQTKYRPDAARLMGRARNLLRENGERMVAEGWDTAYRRSKNAPPASLVYEALIDVLTGWGERAFDQRIDSLPLP